KERALLDPAFGTAVVLLALALIINLSAKVVGKRLRQQHS
ncbi:MAG: phosphate ABC transporter, permease protein PstA, partial [Lawsonibacter sp.]